MSDVNFTMVILGQNHLAELRAFLIWKISCKDSAKPCEVSYVTNSSISQMLTMATVISKGGLSRRDVVTGLALDY